MQDPAMIENRAVLAPAATPAAETEPEIQAKQLTQLQLTWIRFRRHKPALVGAGILIFMILVAVVGPIISAETPYDSTTFDPISNNNIAPSFSLPANSGVQEPGWMFMLGTDNGGHTILSQVVWGARISLEVGFISAFGVSLIGILVGAIAGYFGGWVDTIMMRITDVFLTLPFLPLLLVAADLFGQGHVLVIILIFIAFSWPGVARLARASYLTLRQQEFAEAARAVGVGPWRIIFRHLLPSALRPILVATTLNIAGFIVAEAAIDFLGAGIQPPDVSWGKILTGANGAFVAYGNWWWPVFPGLFLVLTVLAVNFLGDGLGDALDVRSRV